MSLESFLGKSILAFVPNIFDELETESPPSRNVFDEIESAPKRNVFDEIEETPPPSRAPMPPSVAPDDDFYAGGSTARGSVGVPSTPTSEALQPRVATEPLVGADVPIINPKAVRMGIDLAMSNTPVPKSARELMEGFKQGTAEQIAGLSTPKSIAMAPAFAVPVVGPLAALGMGAASLGTGLGKTVGALEAGNMEEAGVGLSEVAGGGAMLLGGAHGTTGIIRPKAPIPPIIRDAIVEHGATLPKAAAALAKDVGQQLEKPIAPEPIKTTEVTDAKAETPAATPAAPAPAEAPAPVPGAPAGGIDSGTVPVVAPETALTLDGIMAADLSSAELGLANRSPEGVATLERLLDEADSRSNAKAKNHIGEALRVAQDQIQDSPALQAEVARVQKRWTAKELPDEWQISVTPEQELPEGGEKMPGNVQVVDPGQTDTSKSPTLESLRSAGYNVPDFQSLPKGKYTVKQAKEMLGASARSTEPVVAKSATTAAQRKADAAQFTARLKEYGEQLGFIQKPDDVHGWTGGSSKSGQSGASVKGKVRHDREMAATRKRAITDLGGDPAKPDFAALNAELEKRIAAHEAEQAKAQEAEMGVETPLTGNESTEFLPPEPTIRNPRTVEPPKLGEKEQGTGDLLKTQTEPEGFKLTSEEVTDQDRVAAEKAKAEADKAAAAKNQMDLPGTEEHIPMGAATPADIPETGVPADETHGIAARVREQRRLQGVTGPVEPGKGIAAEESVEHGRDLIAAGRDPEGTLSLFERTKALSAEDMAVVRAHSERLAREAREAAAKYGVNSPEYEAAWEKGFEWDKRTKPMQTEWHKIGMAQQGEVEIDTGTFHGLRRAFNDATGKDFTPGQAETAKGKAAKVSKADQDAAVAKTHLYNELDRQASAEDAEAKAIDAANKTVREAAARAADDVTKARAREAAAKTELDRLRNDVEAKAERAASKTVREAAARISKDVTKAAEREAAEQKATERIKAYPEERAQQAVHTAHQEAAARAAKAERVAAIKKAVLEKKNAEAARKTAERRMEKVNAVVRAAAVRAAKAVTKERVAKADLPSYVWTKAREYIENGMEDFNDVRNKLATDLGMSVDKVTAAMGKTKRAKYLADELWRKQQTARMMKSQAKRWVTQTAIPKYLRALQSVPRILFGLKVGFHGTVALGTHAPMVAFQPPFWKTYIRDFGKMYKMVGSKAYYESQVQDLIRRPNYVTARRAGLVNDPFTYEDFNSPDTVKYFDRITGMGNRGYSVLKILRQDMFDQQWNSLPKTAQVPEVAKAIADGLNHATGVVKGSAPTGSNLALFAPRLEASRVAWLAVDPVKALKSFADWKNATQGEKMFAINQVKEKAWVAGTLFSLLAINQGLLWAADSKQKINFTDPLKSDFLKFKAAGMDVSYGNAMLSMARLPVRLYAIREGTGGKTKALVHPDESSYTVLGEYVRSQLSPFASLASSLWFKSDWQNRPLPSSNRPVPRRLALQGAKPYTWPEFWTEQFLPIPFEEAMREVWGHGLGMSPDQIDHMLKAMATISVMGATGGRVVEDRSLPKE